MANQDHEPRKSLKGRLKRRRPVDHSRPPLHRRIYLLPSSLTLGNMFFGFYSIITVVNNIHNPDKGYLAKAAMALIIAAFLDGIDGKVAKLTHLTSDFGLQLDSLADVISFGLAPGILAYAWALQPHARFGWLPAFLFLTCGTIRLARFNVQTKSSDPRYFTGLPIPAAAIVVVSMVLLKPDLPYRSILAYLIICFLYILSFLMVSTIQYRSFKEADIKSMKPVKTILGLVLILVIIMHNPKLMIFLFSFVYAVSGVIMKVLPHKLPKLGKFKGKIIDNIAEQISEVDDLVPPQTQAAVDAPPSPCPEQATPESGSREARDN